MDHLLARGGAARGGAARARLRLRLSLSRARAYLSFFLPLLTYAVTIAPFAFGAAGVVSSVLSVPLSTVTLTEDLGMVAMAAVMLAMG